MKIKKTQMKNKKKMQIKNLVIDAKSPKTQIILWLHAPTNYEN